MKRTMTSNLWLVFALLSALFAALTSIFAKVGIEGVNSNLATALRTIVKSAIGCLLIAAGTLLMVL